MNNENVICALQHLVGTPYDESIKATVTELTGRPRVVGPNDISTREFDLQRIHVRADDDGSITGFTFG